MYVEWHTKCESYATLCESSQCLSPLFVLYFWSNYNGPRDRSLFIAGGGEAEGLGLNKVRFILADSPYERYFTEVIPSNNIWWLSRSPSPCLHFPSKFEWSPLWILPKFQWSPLLGFQLRLIPPFVLLKIKWSPLKSSAPPAPRTISNDRSPRTKISMIL